MRSGTLTSLVRMSVLVLLVLAIGFASGGTLRSQGSQLDSATKESQREAAPTEQVVVDFSAGTQSAPTEVPAAHPTEAEPTAPAEVAQAPEPTATSAPALPTEPAATGRGTFGVPENTTGSSILVQRGPADKAYVALTFDAGEGRGYTIEILDFLKERGIRASFGTTAAWATENPDLINRILDEGHLLFNHSTSHQSWTGYSSGADPLTDDERSQEVTGADSAVQTVADWSMKPFWRPPYGDYDANGQVLLAAEGYDYTLMWTCDTLAWQGRTAAEIAAWCAPATERGGNGAIILMHVTQEQDYLSLEQLVTEYEAAGFEFVTVDKMIGS